MELGATERNIVQQAIRSGQPIPDRIQNAPRLRLGLNLYLNAYFDLDAERQMGMALGHIPWSSITTYARFYEFDDEQTDALIFFIRAMDVAHLKQLDQKNKKG